MTFSISIPGRQFAKSTIVVVPPHTAAFEMTSGGAAWTLRARAGIREREPGVRMWLDAAGNHDLAGRVDHAPDVATERVGLGDGHDGFPLHGDVPRAHAPRRHHAPTTNDEIEHDPCSL